MSSETINQAMDTDNWDTVRDLLIIKPSLSKKELEKKYGEKQDTILVKAAKLGKQDIVDMLLAVGADIEATNKSGDTALMNAAEHGHLATLQLLLDKGADIKHLNDYESTALIKSAENGHSEVVALLCEKGADIEALDWKKEVTALTAAAANGHSKVVDILCKIGSNIESRELDAFSALIIAAKKGHLTTVEVLLNNGVAIDKINEFGYFALMVAAENGHSEVAALLCDRGASLDAKRDIDDDDEGRETSLMAAARNGHSAVVDTLCARGANIHAENDYGQTALGLAINECHADVAKILLIKGATIDCRRADIFRSAEWKINNFGLITPNERQALVDIDAMILRELGWRRVKNFIVFLHTGGLSSVDWSVRRSDGSIPPVPDGVCMSPGPVLCRRQHRKVLENRDLCRIISSYITHGIDAKEYLAAKTDDSPVIQCGYYSESDYW